MKIGTKIRRLRKLRGLTIEELAEKANLTKGFISQVERDLSAPSVINLKQVLDVLGVSLASFFSDLTERENNIFNQRDRISEVEGNNFKIENLIPKLKYLEMEPILLTLEPFVEYDTEFQEDEGFGFVVKGTLSIKIDNEKKTVRRGDCFYIFYDSKLFLKNLSKKSAEILIVNY
jgi:transcriptional regulator with XRE-family HTH domain